MHHILADHLKIKNLSVRLVPHFLTRDQKSKHSECTKNCWKNCNPNKISELLTEDETLVYYFEPQQHINNKQWLSKNQARPVIAKRIGSSEKFLYAIFFNSSGPVVQISCKDGKTITGKFYKNKILAAVK